MHNTLSDYIVDLTQNSVFADSSVVIVDLLERDGYIKVYIADNGAGMDAETMAQVRAYLPENQKNAPICTCNSALVNGSDDGLETAIPTRKGGQGIPYLAKFIEKCGGTWDIASEQGIGTSLFFEYDGKNPNAPPMGDIVAAVICCFGMAGECELKFNRSLDDKSYSVMRSETARVLGDLTNAEALITLREYLLSSENELIVVS